MNKPQQTYRIASSLTLPRACTVRGKGFYSPNDENAVTNQSYAPNSADTYFFIIHKI
jgi:hypothetical protein